MIDCFVSIITCPIFTILLRLIYFCFNIDFPYDMFCDIISKYSVSLLRFLFVSHVRNFLCGVSFVCRLKYPYNCFSSQLLLYSYCYSVVSCFFCAILGRYNNYSFSFHNAIFELSCRCISAILKADESSFFLSLTYIICLL